MKSGEGWMKETTVELDARLILLAIFLSASLFLIDISTPLGVAGGVPYIAVVLLTLWLPGTRSTLFFATLCTGLTILGFYWSPAGGELWKVLANRFLALFVIWVTATLSLYRKLAERELHKGEEQLKASLEEKEVLLEEVHHRVNNNLQLISSFLALRSRQVSRVDQLVEKVQDQIQAIALVHENVYASENLHRMDVGRYLQELADYLINAHQFGEIQVDLKITSEVGFIEVDKAIPCGLILHELITNCFKHAFPERKAGTIWINFFSHNGSFILSVKDDGVGFDGIDFQNLRSPGLALVNTLATQLKGELVHTDRNTFQLKFPVFQK